MRLAVQVGSLEVNSFPLRARPRDQDINAESPINIVEADIALETWSVLILHGSTVLHKCPVGTSKVDRYVMPESCRRLALSDVVAQVAGVGRNPVPGLHVDKTDQNFIFCRTSAANFDPFSRANVLFTELAAGDSHFVVEERLNTSEDFLFGAAGNTGYSSATAGGPVVDR